MSRLNSTIYTTSNGRPITNPTASQRIGPNGPVLLQDFNLIDLLAHFDRERIPERVVHAKGGGAFGEFEVTDDVTDVTSADFLSEVGKKTPLAIRFSTVGGEKGAADTMRDPRGFAIKFYTQEGNFDMVMNATPVFFIRDGVKFPTLIHSQKRNPQTNLRSATSFWDFISSNQESAHQIMTLFSDRGTPASWRFQHGWSAHTFKFTKTDGTWSYMKLHFIADGGFKTLTQDEATHLFRANPDWNTEDLFNAIAKKNFPTWTLYCQTLSPEQAQSFRWNIFDVTKVWPHSEVPLRKMGKVTLNRNPENYFAEIEQLAFAPSHLVPGIEPSADPMLQARLFSYADSQRHRLGVNYQQLPVNRPLNVYAPWQRDGPNALFNYGSAPNYPSPLKPIQYAQVDVNQEHEQWVGQETKNLWEVTDEDFVQPRALWEVLGRQEGQQEHFVYNVSVHLSGAVDEVRQRTYGMFARVDAELGKRIEEATERVLREQQRKEKRDSVVEGILARLES